METKSSLAERVLFWIKVSHSPLVLLKMSTEKFLTQNKGGRWQVCHVSGQITRAPTQALLLDSPGSQVGPGASIRSSNPWPRGLRPSSQPRASGREGGRAGSPSSCAHGFLPASGALGDLLQGAGAWVNASAHIPGRWKDRCHQAVLLPTPWHSEVSFWAVGGVQSESPCAHVVGEGPLPFWG